MVVGFANLPSTLCPLAAAAASKCALLRNSPAKPRVSSRFFQAFGVIMTAANVNAANVGASGRTPSFLEGARLLDQSGQVVPVSSLDGTSVALYIAGEWCPMCTSFTPDLKAFYNEHRTCTKTGARRLTVIFVSSDFSKSAAEAHFARQGDWLTIDYDSPLRQELKRRYKVWGGREIPELGAGRRSGVPGVVVVGRDGAELQFLRTEAQGLAALRQWEVDKHVW